MISAIFVFYMFSFFLGEPPTDVFKIQNHSTHFATCVGTLTAIFNEFLVVKPFFGAGFCHYLGIALGHHVRALESASSDHRHYRLVWFRDSLFLGATSTLETEIMAPGNKQLTIKLTDLETEKGTSTLGQRLHRSTQEHDDGWSGKP